MSERVHRSSTRWEVNFIEILRGSFDAIRANSKEVVLSEREVCTERHFVDELKDFCRIGGASVTRL